MSHDEQLNASLESALQAARPETEGSAHAVWRARAARGLFGKVEADRDPQAIDRYKIVERLGSGGMGVVYRAWDPKLQRLVAIKLLHPEFGTQSATANQRLRNEALALASIKHPNVVAVHDADIFGNQTFIVMELIEGQTLRQWLASPRPWREVLAAYIDAGKGLAAAHRERFIHRDFKPENVLIDREGRVRVADFGLVHHRENAGQNPGRAPAGSNGANPTPARDDGLDGASSHDGHTPATAPGPRSSRTALRSPPEMRPSTRDGDSRLTREGTLLGTPGYIAPELLAGARSANALSDQFSFCVALYRGLYDQWPFPRCTDLEQRGPDAYQLQPPASSGDIRPAIFAVLKRGLSHAPGDRHETMEQLLAALERAARPPSRARYLALAALVVVVALASAPWLGRQSPVQQCGIDADTAYSEHRDIERRITDTRAAADLAQYRRALRDTHKDACEAHNRGERSATLYDKQVACLYRNHQSFLGLLESAGSDTAGAQSKLADAVARLPVIAKCRDLSALGQGPAPPPAEIADSVRDRQKALARAQALSDLGDYEGAMKLAQRAVQTIRDLERSAETPEERRAYRRLLAEAELTTGRIIMVGTTPRAAAARFKRAWDLAEEDHGLALEAMARFLYVERRIYSESESLGQIDALGEMAANAASLGIFPVALFRNNIGVAHLAHGRRQEAREHFERAYELLVSPTASGELELIDPERIDAELLIIIQNLALVTSDPSKLEHLAARGLALSRAKYAETHTQVLGWQQTRSRLVAEPDHAELEHTCASYDAHHERRFNDRIQCWRFLAALEAERGNRAGAAERYRHIVALIESATSLGEREQILLPAYRELARGYALMHEKRYDEAVAPLESALATWRSLPEAQWPAPRELAYTALAIGISRHRLGDLDGAREALERARERAQTLASVKNNTEYPRLRACAQSELAALDAPSGQPCAW